MSTAIVAQYTDEGFAIAADSLRKNALTGEDVSTKVQKVFPIEEKQNKRVLAYGLAGAVDIPDSDGVSLFNFADEFSTAAQRLTDVPIAGLDSYAKQLSGLVNERLLMKRQIGDLSSYPSIPNAAGVIAKVMLVGYYRDVGCLVELDFRHSNQTLLEPAPGKSLIGPTSFEVFSGSNFIVKKMFRSKDVKFSKYRTRSLRKGIPPQTLSEATELVRNYIQACIDNQSRDEECKSIGGQPQVATISPEHGFEWVIPPL
jgi:hypothetical protein